jgi:acetoin utilization deacetylase AcuC-like enzyme
LKIYTHASCLDHEVSEGHPERPQRLGHLLRHLDACGLMQDHELLAAPAVKPQDVLRVHSQSHLAFLESMLPTDGVVPVDPDTWMGANSLNAAYGAAGAVCAAVTGVLDGADARAFCAVRPPGHHAERSAAMGFCLLNSIAIGAELALTQPGIAQVAILDFDVHHGNGTVAAFEDRPEVLVCSTFQHPHYPNRLYDLNRPNIVNSPLAAGAGSNEFRKAVESQWLPALAAHRPHLILVSAGFDAHRRDPLADINLTETDFAWVTRTIVDAANAYADGRIVSVLEGGYDLQALAASAEAHIGVLAG